MRMPNGYGSVYRLSGKRRKPYVARKTVGFNEKRQPIYKAIGYYRTKKEAIDSLNEYNRKYGTSPDRPPLFSEVFEEWYGVKLNEKLSDSRYSNLRSLYRTHLAPLHSKTFKDITLEDLQRCVDVAQTRCKKATLVQIRSLYAELYRYALYKGTVDRDVSSMVKVPKRDDRTERVPFSAEEVETLRNGTSEFDRLIYVMVYTGFRASEFIAIRREDVSEDYVITGGMKSKAGRDRKVPCNDRVAPLVAELLSDGREYLVGSKMNYNQFVYRFRKAMEAHGMHHTPHDTRHTFVTLLSNADANRVSIKRLTGHATSDVTDGVYTHKDVEQLRKAVNLI